MMKKIAACLLSLGLLSACQSLQPNRPDDKGALKITVQFPEQSFSTQLIRPETRVIYVAVYNDNQVGQPQIFGPITPRNPQVRLSQLPAGNQTIVAAAYDDQKQILTAGRSLALVKANALSQASLELESDYNQALAAEQLKLLQGLEIHLPALDSQLATDLLPAQNNLNPNLPVNVTVPAAVPVTEGIDLNTGARSETTTQAGQELVVTSTPTPSPASRAAASAAATPEPVAAASATPVASSTPEAAPVTAPVNAPVASTTPAAQPNAEAEKAKQEKAEKEAKEKKAKADKEKAEKEAKQKKEKEVKEKSNRGRGHGHHDHDDDDHRGRGHDHDDDHDDD